MAIPNQGARGQRGLEGRRGRSGKTGLDGVGRTGPQGNPGIRGRTGKKGTAGARGKTGVHGVAGTLAGSEHEEILILQRRIEDVYEALTLQIQHTTKIQQEFDAFRGKFRKLTHASR